MADQNHAAVHLVDAASIPGVTAGGIFTLGAVATASLAEYAGRYVKLYSLDDDFRFCFQALGSTTALVTTATAIGTASVPDACAAGAAGVMRIVPKKAPQLRFVAIGGGGLLYVIPC